MSTRKASVEKGRRYRIVVTTNPQRVTMFFMENGSKYLWTVRKAHDGRTSGEMPIIARGSADTKWGARCAAKRYIKEYEHTPGKRRTVSDRMWSP